MKRFKLKTVLVSLVCFAIMTGCSNKEEQVSTKQSSSASEEKLHVVTTFYPMYEFTKNIAKDKAQVDLLIPSNIEPHDWEPTPKDMATIQKADVLFITVLLWKPGFPSIQESLDKDQPLFVEASEGIPLMEGVEHDHHDEGSGHKDQETDHHHDEEAHKRPYIRSTCMVKSSTCSKRGTNDYEALVKKDPNNKDYYKSNSQELFKN